MTDPMLSNMRAQIIRNERATEELPRRMKMHLAILYRHLEEAEHEVQNYRKEREQVP